ncbi:carbonic anhydrase [Penicillium taxi]|uniref:carbonic anhydrase n=1 Tax=Penicillium taxi TaxID=168475 RepID=UPI0025458881|nr:carbonic anhydrase [Penicillium taxi]KAJ5895624.1 carbonic anhydrase [Penicillium taxi]
MATVFSNPPSNMTRTDHITTGLIPSLQKPVRQVLWIGCCDSSFRETTIHNLLPEEILEHRNLGNMIIEGDLSCETAVKHAIVDLQVKHIVICGHYGCGIVKAASREGLQGPWSSKLDSLYTKHQGSIDQLPAGDRDRSFVELNILQQVSSLQEIPEVADAIRQGNVRVHGIVYDPVNGKGLSVADAGYDH